jgi:hypothetical protein
MIEIKSARMALCACPTVWIGQTIEDHTVYCRYRWGNLSVRLSTQPNPEFAGAGGTCIAEIARGGPYDGFIDYEDLREATRELIVWPETHQ